jgi:hypothetical protein
MASSINASTGPGGGVATTADASGNLNLQSNGTTVVAVTSTGVAVTGTLSATGAVTLTTALPVLQGGTGVTTSTGTGAVVLGTSPTLTTPIFNSASLVTISGNAPLYMCRAWGNFTGITTATIRAGGNIGTFTRTALGRYTLVFSTAMPSADYSVSSSGAQTNTSSGQYANVIQNLTTTGFTIVTLNATTASDNFNIFIQVTI